MGQVIPPERLSGDAISVVPGCKGIVIQEILIGTDGGVHGTSVLRSLSPTCDAAAENLVAHWRFRPAAWNAGPLAEPERACSFLPGEPVSVYLTIAVKFPGDAPDA